MLRQCCVLRSAATERRIGAARRGFIGLRQICPLSEKRLALSIFVRLYSFVFICGFLRTANRFGNRLPQIEIFKILTDYLCDFVCSPIASRVMKIGGDVASFSSSARVCNPRNVLSSKPEMVYARFPDDKRNRFPGLCGMLLNGFQQFFGERNA